MDRRLIAPAEYQLR